MPKPQNNVRGSIRKKRMAAPSIFGVRRTFLALLAYVTSATHLQEQPKIDAVLTHCQDTDTLVKGERAKLDLSGKGFSSRFEVALTLGSGERGDHCEHLVTKAIRPNIIGQTRGTLSLLPAHTEKIQVVGEGRVWFCIRETHFVSDRGKAGVGGFKRELGEGDSAWIHQGAQLKLKLVPKSRRTKCILRTQTKECNHLPKKGTDPNSTYSALQPKSVESGSQDDHGIQIAIRLIPANDSEENVNEITTASHNRNVRSLNGSDDSEYAAMATVKPPVVYDVEGYSADKNIQVRLGNFMNETTDVAWKNEQYKLRGWPVPLKKYPKDILTIRVEGLRIENYKKELSYDQLSGIIMANTVAEVRLFGSRFTKNTEILFTGVEDEFGAPCGSLSTQYFPLKDVGARWAIADVSLPPMLPGQNRWYLCTRSSPWEPTYHQGTSPWLSLKSYTEFLPLWIKAVFISILLALAGLFSGLNIGLMALDKTELRLVATTGTPEEKEYVRALEPIRSHGNFLLCTVLLGNVLVNASLTVLMDDLTTGLVAIILSTVGIVVFGEIVPQAICTRYGLAAGARTVWLVKLFMIITGPVSYPVSKILDYILGEELGVSYDRERLKELLKVTHQHTDIRPEEHNIICAALDLNKRTVLQVMRNIDDVYMLSIDVNLSFDTINEITRKGYSRIPVYEGNRKNIVSLLLTRDLACIHPDENTLLRTICHVRQHPLNFVSADTTLDVMFRNFKKGSKGHMAFVLSDKTRPDGSSYADVVGILTLNDVIKEVLHGQIVHEPLMTDHYDYTEFSKESDTSIHPQLQVAALQYLHASVEPFKDGRLSEDIIKSLIGDEALHCVEEANDETPVYLYKQGKPADYLVLILEGRVEVNIGKENLTFWSGPFTCFGSDALSQMLADEGEPSSSPINKPNKKTKDQTSEPNLSFIPDYSVKLKSKVSYLKIYCRQYMAARRVFLEEQSQQETEPDSLPPERADASECQVQITEAE
ncbi:unextended protein-like [Macrobrachium rosenbergii]|uniref:unextended protein-like n=1 Tax=Macrobrachium rosenbergii TaxID=79674 RepID=UPI0034D57BD9